MKGSCIVYCKRLCRKRLDWKQDPNDSFWFDHSAIWGVYINMMCT